MPITKVKANYAENSVRSARHAELDRVYAQADPDLALPQVNTVADAKGKTDQVEIEFKDGAYQIEGKTLDREGWLVLAKAASRLAQSI